MEYQCNQRSREERIGTIGASSAHNSAKYSAKFRKLTIRPLAWQAWPNRFWKPDRGQNGSKLNDSRSQEIRPLLSTAAS